MNLSISCTSQTLQKCLLNMSTLYSNATLKCFSATFHHLLHILHQYTRRTSSASICYFWESFQKYFDWELYLRQQPFFFSFSKRSICSRTWVEVEIPASCYFGNEKLRGTYVYQSCMSYRIQSMIEFKWF